MYNSILRLLIFQSYSSTLTDDEGNDTCYVADRKTKGMEAAFGQNKVMFVLHFCILLDEFPLS